MATRSAIGIRLNNGKIKAVYCHYDGYPEGVGKTLVENYDGKTNATKLISLGDISILDKNMTKPAGHSFNKPVEGYSVFYGRDRGEKNTKAKIYDSVKDIFHKMPSLFYVYVLENNQWMYASEDNQELRPLLFSQNGEPMYSNGGSVQKVYEKLIGKTVYWKPRSYEVKAIYKNSANSKSAFYQLFNHNSGVIKVRITKDVVEKLLSGKEGMVKDNYGTEHIMKLENKEPMYSDGGGVGKILGKTPGGIIIYEGHKFKMYSYPGKWHTEKVIKKDKKGYYTTGHSNPIKEQEFHTMLDNEKVKGMGKLEYFKNNMATGGGVEYNEYGVPNGYLYLSEFANFDSKSSGELTDVSETILEDNLLEDQSEKSQQIHAYLHDLPHFMVYNNKIPHHNPESPANDQPITDNYLIFSPIEDEDGAEENGGVPFHTFFVDTQGYDYPRYITRLVNYFPSDDQTKDLRYMERGGMAKFSNGGGVEGYYFEVEKEGDKYSVYFYKPSGDLDWGKQGFTNKKEAQKYGEENIKKYKTKYPLPNFNYVNPEAFDDSNVNYDNWAYTDKMAKGGVVEEIKTKYQIAGSDKNGVYTYSKSVAEEIAKKYNGDVQEDGSKWYVRLEEQYATGGEISAVEDWVGMDYSKQEIEMVLDALEKADISFPEDTRVENANSIEDETRQTAEMTDDFYNEVEEYCTNLSERAIKEILWGIIHASKNYETDGSPVTYTNFDNEGAYSSQQIAATKAMIVKTQKAKSDMELVLKDLQKMASEDRRFEGDVTYLKQVVDALNAFIGDADKFVIQGKL